jgi:hypothetical protein
MGRATRRAFSLAATLALAACASVEFAPPATDPQPYLARANAQVQTQDGVRVAVAVLRPEESRAVFGLPLADRGVQPVWIRIENASDRPYRLMPAYLDHDYFSPHEVGYRFHGADAARNRAIETLLDARRAPLYVPPRATVSGYVYTNRTRGIKLVNVELAGPQRHLRFAFARELPSGDFDFRTVDVGKLYGPDRLRTVDLAGLRAGLEALACCTTNAGATARGDPLNLAFVGAEHDVLVALVRAGWDFTENTGAAAVGQMIGAFALGAAYRNAPVSPLYFDGRHQDLSMQRARATISQRNHLRLWVTPLRFEGKPVWIGQVSRDIGVRVTFRSPFLTTHAIDPEVDEARDYVLDDLLASGAIERWGLVRGVGTASREAPRENLTGDPYFTDGLRLVVFVAPSPRATTDAAFVPWEPVPGR